MKKQKGFTLIELLVVIAIIAILSTVVMAGLNSARLKGRDARRMADIKQVQAALELYYDSNSGYVVTTSAAIDSALSTTEFLKYMTTLPKNPGPGGTTYTYSGTPSTYTMNFTLEGASGTLTAGLHTVTPSGISK